MHSLYIESQAIDVVKQIGVLGVLKPLLVLVVVDGADVLCAAQVCVIGFIHAFSTAIVHLLVILRTQPRQAR
jgi:hypothetical protein